ncbi:transposase [Salmonella enterica]|uniref:Transposase n=2 Tax=Salmonella TaxID=590 RepID=A0A5U2P815_SALER|nr:hypothetical protein [Salmonella enterica]EBR8139495.1 hypothetical protein [Salmonella enterica subsp. enterica serovar Oranienburg]ECJ4587726.1 hypothetical protein [Salmonella enterica subsp. enterica]EAW6135403.1 transposase [Salmonella enterica]EAW9036420.1 transposase [Salmonella enterica]
MSREARIIQPLKPTLNAFTEYFKRTYRTGIPYFYLFRRLNKVHETPDDSLSEYNCERPYETLSNIIPEEYRHHNYLAERSRKAWN